MKSIFKGISIIFILISFVTYGQETSLEIIDVSENSLKFNWENKQDIILEYGLTKELELGKVYRNEIDNLKDATFYFVRAISEANNKTSDIKLYSTKSRSSGNITVYFNQWVDNNASSITDAIHVTAFEDTIIAYINRSENTLDICNYNTGSLPIVNAINAAESRAVIIRYIAADNTGTNNNELGNLSATIPMIQRPDDGEVMHNKFIIIDSANPTISKVLTGSTNHTDNSCHQDFNNMVIVEDQSLALAYKLEFEEMWGSTTNTPNLTNAKFGNAKTDNTPHSFSIGGKNVELYFSPSDGTTAHIESTILTANTDMQFAMLTFTNNDLGDAVISIHNSGVDVKGIIENVVYFGSEYSGLQSAGVDVHSHFTTLYFLHHKYGIIDANNTSSDPVVITGSHNWTNSAEDDYDENTLIIHDAVIANMYYEEFMARYAEMTGSFAIEKENFSIQISPNPTTGIVIIKNKELKIKNVEVFDIYGKEVLKTEVGSQKIEVDLSSQPKGLYIIKVSTDKGMGFCKLVLE